MKYPCLPGLTPDGTVYQNSAMGTVEAMLPPGPGYGACARLAGNSGRQFAVRLVCRQL